MTARTKDIMTKKVETVSQDSKLNQAANLMREKRIRHLPVTDESGDVVGVLSQRDFSTLGNLSQFTVGMLMTSPVVYIEQNESLKGAINLMLSRKISCLLVTSKDDELVGIVTTDDLLWYLMHLLENDKDKIELKNWMNKNTLGEVATRISEIGI